MIELGCLKRLQRLVVVLTFLVGIYTFACGRIGSQVCLVVAIAVAWWIRIRTVLGQLLVLVHIVWRERLTLLFVLIGQVVLGQTVIVVVFIVVVIIQEEFGCSVCFVVVGRVRFICFLTRFYLFNSINFQLFKKAIKNEKNLPFDRVAG